MAGLVPIGAKLRACAGLSAPSPRLPSGRLRPSEPVIGPAEGRTRWTGYGEGRGEGASPQAQTRGEGHPPPPPPPPPPPAGGGRGWGRSLPLGGGGGRWPAVCGDFGGRVLACVCR